jgi:hypothetical protein
MSSSSSRESRHYILSGLLLLLVGSAMLLVCKLPVPPRLGDVSACVGGAALLWGNYRIIFGLLISAGEPEPGTKQDEEHFPPP